VSGCEPRESCKNLLEGHAPSGKYDYISRYRLSGSVYIVR